MAIIISKLDDLVIILKDASFFITNSNKKKLLFQLINKTTYLT
jgi:hypothetical protein